MKIDLGYNPCFGNENSEKIIKYAFIQVLSESPTVGLFSSILSTAQSNPCMDMPLYNRFYWLHAVT